AFGHMHHTLRHTDRQLRKCFDMDAYGTLYLNAASVPRIIDREGQKRRNFSIVSMEAGIVSQVALVWIDQNLTVISEKILYYRAESVFESAKVL
ncbi:MAG: TIGR04168 family protein, partial [Trichodesmium sp. MAG_R04]|nr:TIGR04168 family protein [Trichodesmium sp. MAG_R04]